MEAVYNKTELLHLFDPQVGQTRPVAPGSRYRADDPIVEANKWAFDIPKPVTRRSKRVEQATAVPGETR
jgi:hypothetical protein